jgi:outer membrane protein assembly factor BamB
MKIALFTLLFSILLSATLQGRAAWPQFRGPNADGLGRGTNLPESWSTNRNVQWKTPVPGVGWSSPVVWGGKVFLTSVVKEGELEAPPAGLYLGGERPISKENHHWLVLCLDAGSGKVIWERRAHEGPPASSIHVKNTHATETPVTDGKHLFAYFGNAGLFCYDFEGTLVWSRQFEQRPTRHGWGTAASPLLRENRLYLVNDNEEESVLLALDAGSGETVWEVKRDEKSNWATPYIWENEVRAELVTNGSKARSYDLDGNLLWELGGMSSIVIPTPFARDGLLYVGSGFVADRVRPIYAVRPGARGDLTIGPDDDPGPHIAWRQLTAAPYNTSPIVYEGHLYVLYDRGLFSCYDARTGALIYDRERLNPGGIAAFTASPWAYQGKIFCLSEEGDTYVVEAGPAFNLERINSLEEMCMATPAIAHNSLFIRTYSALYRITDLTEAGQR